VPRKASPKFRDDDIVVAWQSFGVQQSGVGLIAITEGTRLRGSHPVVKQSPIHFVRDGAAPEEVSAARRVAEPVEDVAPRPGDYGVAPQPTPLRDEDAVLITQAGSRPGLQAGARLAKSDPMLKKLKSGDYVPQIAKGLDPQTALVALEELRESDVDGNDDRVVHKGQYVSRGDRAVALNPSMFVASPHAPPTAKPVSAALKTRIADD
jgi:hypothetical protein